MHTIIVYGKELMNFSMRVVLRTPNVLYSNDINENLVQKFYEISNAVSRA